MRGQKMSPNDESMLFQNVEKSSSAAPARLLQMASGVILQQTLYAAAKLGIADFLDRGQRPVSEIATELKLVCFAPRSDSGSGIWIAAMRQLIALVLASSLGAATATLDGLKIHWSSFGQGTKTVLFVHGWTCNEMIWTKQVPALAKEYHVLTLDLPGHGHSDMPADGKFSMDLFARAVEAVRAGTRSDRIILAGHSMGTQVVLRYAGLYPQHTAALVFVDGVTAGARPNRRGAMMAGQDGRKNRENMIRSMFSPATTPEMQTEILNMMLSTSEATAVGTIEVTFEATRHEDSVLNVPVLAIYAEHSRLANREYLRAHFPNLQDTEIPGTGHFLMLEKPEAFNRVLLASLARQN
jgi:sigma-B regulation protein RsbQ